MGTHESQMALLERLENSIEEMISGKNITPIPFPGRYIFFVPGEKKKGGKTLNFERMGNGIYFIWAHLFGDSEQKAESSMIMKKFLQDEFLAGHMSKGNGTEQCCADPHYNFHLYVMILLWKFSQFIENKDISYLVERFLVSHFTLYTLFASNVNRYPRQLVMIPGTRFEFPDEKLKDSWTVVSTLYREVTGKEHFGNAKDPNDEIWTQYRDFSCCRAARKFNFASFIRNFDLSKKSNLPSLKLELTCRRYQNGVVGIMKKPSIMGSVKDYICNYIVFQFNTGKLIDFGRDWKKEIPKEHFKTSNGPHKDLGRLIDEVVI